MKTKFEKIRPISQEHPLGCSVACVASLCKIKYKEAIQLFKKKEHAWTRGFYCSEVVQALKTAGLNYTFEEFDFYRHSPHVRKTGTIVFIAPNTKYPAGHFLLRLAKGWMNPWSNFPEMKPVRSSIEKFLPGEISYVVYPQDANKSY